MIVEIINPSDRGFMQHEDPEALALAARLMGSGYGLEEVTEAEAWEMPPLFRDRWHEETFGRSAQVALDEKLLAAAEALCSVRLASSVSEYRLVLSLEGDELAAHQDERRSSLNDFAGWARRTGAKILEEARPA